MRPVAGRATWLKSWPARYNDNSRARESNRKKRETSAHGGMCFKEESRMTRHWIRSCSPAILALIVLVALLQPGCLFRKKKSSAPKYPAEPIRIALLPINVPSKNAELRWMSLGGAVLMAKELEQAKDLDVIPLWETLPAAVESLGTSRTLTPEISALIAVRLNARWAAQSELAPDQNGFELRVDFIPAKATLIPFRYGGRAQIDSLAPHFREAFEQFLRYMVARPLGKGGGKSMDSNQLKQLSATLDREYGWFDSADPGKAAAEAEKLGRSDSRLARLLFSPTLYPGSNVRPVSAAPKPQAAAHQTN